MTGMKLLTSISRFLIFVMAIFLSGCTPNQRIAGTYVRHDKGLTDTLIINANGTFEQWVDTDDRRGGILSDTWTIRTNQLLFSRLYITFDVETKELINPPELRDMVYLQCEGSTLVKDIDSGYVFRKKGTHEPTAIASKSSNGTLTFGNSLNMSDNQLHTLKIFGYFSGWLGLALVIFLPLRNLFKGRRLIWVILQLWLYGFVWSVILCLAFPVIAAWIFQDGSASDCFPDGSDFFPDGSNWVVPIAIVGWIPSLVICVTVWLIRFLFKKFRKRAKA